MHVTAIIAAGGRGERFGAGRPKQLLTLGGVSILLGVRPHLGIALVTAFLVPVTLLTHQYWKHTDPMIRINDQVNFMKNVAILGASWMLLMNPKPWPTSLNL